MQTKALAPNEPPGETFTARYFLFVAEQERLAAKMSASNGTSPEATPGECTVCGGA